MKIVILAGGLGTRISEESDLKPKPMIEIGGKPILWHIMKIYSSYGFNDFIICCGYKGYMIKEYFANYFLHMSDVTFDLTKKNELYVHRQNVEPWKVTLVDTGESTLTGGRLKRIYEYVKKDDAFCFTYGDGLTDININQLIKYHYSHGKYTTLPVFYMAREQAMRQNDIAFDEWVGLNSTSGYAQWRSNIFHIFDKDCGLPFLQSTKIIDQSLGLILDGLRIKRININSAAKNSNIKY